MALIDAVAIDGPAGAGKSTIAKSVAKRLGFLYVDTGAMYRCVALIAKRKGIDLEDEYLMEQVAKETDISFDKTGTRITACGEDVSEEIRSPDVTAITRYAARAKGVRDILVKQQQQLAASRPVVMEGRDITTVVLKDARWKFFVTASPAERARRRHLEFTNKGYDVDFNKLLDEIESRDASDMKVGPLKDAFEISQKDDDMIHHLDTTGMSPEEVIDTIENVVKGTENGV